MRYHGGPSAGHEIIYNNEVIVARTIPSGISNPKILCLIASGVIIDPIIFKQELDQIKKLNIEPKGRLFISPECHLLMPWHT